MTRVHLNLNFRNWTSYLPTSLQKLDWRVGAAAGAAFIGIVCALRAKSPFQWKDWFLEKTGLKINFFNAYSDFTTSETVQKVRRQRVNGESYEKYFGTFLFSFLSYLEGVNKFGSPVRPNNKEQIIIDHLDGKAWIESLNDGLPPELTYANATREERAQSWIHQILAKLLEKKYIKEFVITDSQIVINKIR